MANSQTSIFPIRWISTVDAMLPYCDRPKLDFSKFPFLKVETSKFRVTEFTFPILEKGGVRDYSWVQRALWDAIDITDSLKREG